MTFVFIDSFRSALVQVNEFAVIKSHEVQDGCMEIVDVQSIFYRVQTNVIGRAVSVSGADSSTGHPHGEAGGIVIAAVALLAHRSPTELAPPHDQRLIQKSALPQIGQQTGYREIHLPAHRRMILFDA
jgi:hypothetical protein